MRLSLRVRAILLVLTTTLAYNNSFSQCNNTVTTFPIQQTFELGLQDWYQADDDDFDWYLHTGSTSSNNTGPSSAYEGTKYMYTERSGLSHGDEAILLSPCFTLPSGQAPFVSFRLHQFGNAASLGTLTVRVTTNPSSTSPTWTTLATYTGNLGNSWNYRAVDLSSYAGQTIKIQFRAVVGGSGFSQNIGDRAIDDVLISTGYDKTDVECEGDASGSATAIGEYGDSPYSYVWNTGDSTQTISNLTAGNYTVTISDDSSVTRTVNVTIDEKEIPSAPSITSSSTSTCSNITDTITLSVGTPDVDYEYRNQTDDQFTTTSAGDLNFDFDNLVGIPTSDALVEFFYMGDLDDPTPSGGGGQGEGVRLSGEGNTLILDSLNTSAQCDRNFDTVQATIDLTTLADWASDGEIQLDGDAFGGVQFGCLDHNRIWRGLVAISYDYSTFKPYWFVDSCPTVGGSVSAAIDSGYSIDVSPTTTTTYYVAYIDPSCGLVSGCDSVTITVESPPTVTTNLDSAFYCSSAVSLTASGASTYVWSPGVGLNTTTSATVLASPASNTLYTVVGTDGNGCTDTAGVFITVTSGPSVSISSTNVNCNGGNDGTATATGSGGTGSFTYSWNTGSSSSSISGLTAGTYTVTVDDGTNCTATQSVTITQPSVPLTVTIVPFNILCFGQSNGQAFASVFGGTPSYSYSWSTGSSSSLVSSLGAGTYTVTVTDNNSCTSIDTVTITEPTAELEIDIDTVVNVLCFGENTGSATASATGGTPSYDFSWSNGSTGATVTGLTAGTYSVTVEDDNGCSDFTNITVTQPSTAVTVSITSSTDVTCNGGSDGSATASASGGTGSKTFNWSSGSSSATASGLTAGTYTVTATDQNGCEDTETVTISEPTPVSGTFTSTNVSCNGDSDGSATITGNGGNGGAYAYVWSTGSTSSTISGLTAGTYTVTIEDNSGCEGVESILITEPSVLVASIGSPTNVSCNGGNDGSATASASGGTPTYSYSWSSGGSAATETGLTAGTFTVTVTDANGCEDTETVTITEPTALVASASVDQNVSCFGGNDGEATASGSGGTSPYSYSWSSGASTATATGLTAGTYTVTVEDDNGCTDTDQITITEPSSAVSASASVDQNVSCNGGNDGEATASGSGGTSPYSYSWSSGASAATATGLTAGTYTVTVTDDNGCEDTESVTITEPTVLVASIGSSSNVSCNGGNDGSATASGSGGTSPYSYSWNTGGSSATITGLTAGTYTVTVTDNNSCEDTETITITEPTVLVASIGTPTNVSCNGGNDGAATASGSGGTSPYSYAWSSGGSSATESGLTAGTYTVTVTDDNGCDDTETVTITEPTVLVASASVDQNVSCFGGNDGEATASGSGGTSPYSYSWSSGASTATATGLTAGTYTVTVEDDNGCTDTDQITITEPSSAVSASASVDQNVSCNGGNDGEATASGSGGTSPYSYSWSSGASAATATGLTAGTYTVTVTDDNGCEDTESVTITEPTVLVASIGSSSNVSCNGGNDGSATASGSGGTSPYSYSWNTGGSSATITGLTAGTYTVTVTDNNSCEDTETITITEPTVLVASIGTPTNVSCNGGNDGAATASGSGGTSPYSYAWSSGGSAATESGLTAGTYTVTVTDDNGCDDTETVTITEPTVLVASASVDQNVSCFGGNDGEATASGSGGTSPYSFSWSSGASTATATGLTAGTYTVTVEDDNGCTDTDQITITEPSSAVSASASVDQNVSCNGGNDGEATASGSGGTSPYSYSWSSGASAATATGLTAGTYTVTVTDDNGCEDTESVTITEPTVLVASIGSSSNVSCNGGNDGSATASGSGGTSPYTYAWNTGGSSATITGLTAGTYTVTVTDDNSCDDTETITITEPTVLVAAAVVDQNVSCNGGNDGEATASASGGTSPYSYSWSSGGSSANETGLTAGTYTVTVTDDNGCTDTESITITEPTLLVATIDSTQNISCNGLFDGIIYSSASGGTSPYSYSWSSGASTATASGLGAGTYTVTITDDNGCTATASATITEPSVLVAATSVDQNVSCNGGNDGEATASATGGTSPYSFAWSSGGTSATETGLTAGTYTVTVTDDNGCDDTETVTITEPTLLVASASVDQNVSCNGNNDGEATASASGGTSPYSYSWSSGGTSATETGLTAGTYVVTVTDDNGCEDTASVTITEPDELIATGSGQNVSCNGAADGEATANVTGGTSPYTYAWSTGSTLSTAINLGPGTYICTVTDANGCTDTAAVTITEPATLIVSASVVQHVSCPGGNDGSATTAVTGGTPGFSYTWSSGGGSFTEMTMGAGPYTVTVEDVNGCTDTSMVVIFEPDTFSSFAAVDNNVSCFGGNDGQATAFASGGTPGYSYNWSNGDTNAVATGLTAGSYAVTITDSNGCINTSSSLSVTISEPSLLLSNAIVTQDVSCNGGNDGTATASGSGGTSPYTYSWNTGGSSATITGLTAGTYTVTVTDNNSCEDTETVTITEPTALIASAVVDENASCNGSADGEATASASGGTSPYSYSWNTGSTSANVTGLAAGTYSVTVTDDNGCTDSASVTISEPNALSSAANVFGNYSCWYSDSGFVAASATGGTAPYSYSWDGTPLTFGNGDTAIYIDTAGSMFVTVTDDNGCIDSASFTLSFPDSIEVTFSTDSALCATGSSGSVTATLTGGTGSYTYYWPNNSDSTSNTSSGYSTGTYYMEFRDGNGCLRFDSFTIVAPDTLSLALTITDVNCNAGSDGSIVTAVNGGTTPYTYSWNTGSTASSLTGLTAGTYTITVTDDNGCDTALAAVVQEPDTIANTFSSIAITCNGSTDGSLIASGSGGTSPFTYSWSSGSTTDTASNLGAGTYTVTITDDNGCSNIFSTSLSEPAVLAASILLEDSTGCAGDSSGMAVAGATGGTSPYSYAWPAGLTQSNDTLFSVPAGTYQVTVTDDNGCIDSAIATILGPDSIFLSIDSFTNVTCVGGNDGYASVLATGGSGSFTYAWPNGSTTAAANNLTVGQHCVTVTDQNGCSDSVCVTLIEMNPLPLVDLGNDTAVCDTGYMLDAGLASAYQWNTGEITQSISASSTGTYTVTVTDINGCQNFDEVNIVINALLAFDVEVDSADCGTANGSALVANIQGGGNYQINWSTGQIGGVSASNLAWGNYTVTVTDQNGCAGAENFFVFDNSDMITSTYAEDASCNGTTDGLAAVAIVSGGASPFDYDWSNGGTGDTIMNIAAGTYYVTIEDDSGCHAIDTVDVGEPDAILITTAALNADCGDSNGYAAIATITPPASYTYAWNDPSAQTTDTAYNVPAGLYTVTVTAPNGCTETALTIVNNVNGPAVSMSAVDAFCENLGTGMAIASASGASPFTYEWSDPNAQTNDTASLLVNDTYFATVTDVNGCITIDSISVGFINPAPLMSLSNDTIACADSVDLTPGGGFTTYSWSTGSGAPSITVTASGTYGVTVSDAIGCVNSDSVAVTLYTPITYSSVISNSNCTSPTGSVAITVLTGNGSYTYDWSTGDTTSTINNVFAGNYGLTIEDAVGCEVNDTIVVDWINAPGLLVTFNNASCNGVADANAAAIVNGGTYPYTYNWSTGGTDSTETGLGAGVYEITVTDDSGCVVQDLFVVAEPSPMNFQFLTNSPACGENDGNILVNVFNSQGPITTYLWDDPNAITLPYADSLFAGYYTVVVTDSAGCLDSGSVALSNDGAPVLSMNSVDNNCSNETGGIAYVFAVGDDPFSYAWNDPMAQTNDTAFALGVGTYAVSVTDTNGCIAIGQTSVGYFFDAPTVDLGENIAACDGDEVIVTPGSGYSTYFWSTGTFSNSITVTSDGTVDVTVTNSVGCAATDSVAVQFFTPPVVDLGNDTVVCLDDTIGGFTLDAGAGFNNYMWSTSDTTQTLTVNQSGYYQVTVSQVAGCEGSDGVVIVFDTCVNVTVEELRAGSSPGIILFPNPNRGQFVLKTTGLESGMYDVNLMNVNGQSVLRENVRIESGIDTRNSYDLGTTARGVYILTITGEGLRFDQRVIIQ